MKATRESIDRNANERRGHLFGLWFGAALVASAAAAATHAPPQVFRCVDADGHVVLTDTSCGSNSEKVTVVQSSGGLSQIKSDGLSAQEKSVLGAAEARAAASQSQQAGAPAHGAAPAPAASAPVAAPRSGY